MTNKPKALDLFCGAGGVSMGLHLAGFDVTGVDDKYQKNYPFKFIQADAMDFDVSDFDVVFASPPCQFYSYATPEQYKNTHPNLIAKLRNKLIKTVLPFVIENVSGARFYLRSPIKLCGSMFGLPVRRHRYFEIGNIEIGFLVPPCAHSKNTVLVTGTSNKRINGRRVENTVAEKKAAMQINWMTEMELTQAISPAYSKFLGEKIFSGIS